jgi:zinc finger-like protein
MHAACFRDLAARSYACPVCSKSLGDMRVYWGMLDALLARDKEGGGGGGGGAALPPALAGRTQAIACNDCGVASTAPFHFVYHKCAGCGGYNTRLV